MKMEKLIVENRTRSMTKSIVWRILGIIFLAFVTWIYTGNLIQTTSITFLHHFIFVFLYYLHDRLWQRPFFAKFTGLKRKIYRTFLYEIILGQSVLATVTAVITFITEGAPSIQKMTTITWTYIFNKLWMYVVYDKIWDRVNWGTKQT